jgi:hypothetical protein
MNNNKWIVVTTINPPGTAIEGISKLCAEGWSAVVVGDTKTPENWSAPGISFLSMDDQKELFGKLAELIPSRHYCRKNLGYAYAMSHGASVILETDDDNVPYKTFGQVLQLDVEGQVVEADGWVNIYKYFTDAPIWPRGLPLDEIRTAPALPDALTTRQCPIQQSLADVDPDVDAIYRLVSNSAVSFEKRLPVIAGENSWVPFNSQNTTFFPKAFPLLYLPCYVSFRMTDIWRSFVAQAALWNHDANVAFCSATVEQIRNEHNLMKDFEDEVPGYLGNTRMAIALNHERNKLAGRRLSVSETAFELWRRCFDEKIIPAKELEVLEAWMEYVAPCIDKVAQ